MRAQTGNQRSLLKRGVAWTAFTLWKTLYICFKKKIESDPNTAANKYFPQVNVLLNSSNLRYLNCGLCCPKLLNIVHVPVLFLKQRPTQMISKCYGTT